jgi:Sec-independent protein secretion pathway component TatC
MILYEISIVGARVFQKKSTDTADDDLEEDGE